MDRHYGIDNTYTCNYCSKVFCTSRYRTGCPICGRHNDQIRYYTQQQLQKIKWQKMFWQNYSYEAQEKHRKQSQQQCKLWCSKHYLIVVIIGLIIMAIGLLIIILSAVKGVFWNIIYGTMALLCGFFIFWMGKGCRKQQSSAKEKLNNSQIQAADIPPEEKLQEAFQKQFQ